MTPGSKDMINSLLDENPNEQLKALGILMMSVLEEVKGLKELIAGPSTFTGTISSGYATTYTTTTYGNPYTAAITNTPSTPSPAAVASAAKAAAALSNWNATYGSATIAQKQQQDLHDIRNSCVRGYIDTACGTLSTDDEDEDEPPVVRKKPLFDRIFGSD